MEKKYVGIVLASVFVLSLIVLSSVDLDLVAADMTESSSGDFCLTADDCRDPHYVGSSFCSGGDKYRTLRSYTCPNNRCDPDDESELEEDCGDSECASLSVVTIRGCDMSLGGCHSGPVDCDPDYCLDSDTAVHYECTTDFCDPVTEDCNGGYCMDGSCEQ
jgi:hypothetical protein